MAIEAQELRRVMGHFATGVTVITTKDKKTTVDVISVQFFPIENKSGDAWRDTK